METSVKETLVSLKDVLESLSFIVILLGIPVAIFQYYRAKKKEQMDREYGAYNSLDEKYLEFLNLCFQFPHLNIFDVADQTSPNLDDQQKKQELIALTMLISIMERAFLMYQDQSTDIKKRQWSGWDEYMTNFCKRENFISAWHINGNHFDLGYQNYMKHKIETCSLIPVKAAQQLIQPDPR